MSRFCILIIIYLKMKKTLLLLSLFFNLLVNAQAEDYYNDVDLTLEGLALKENLATKTINAHTLFLDYTWEASRITDIDPNNSNNVLLIYGWENGSDGDVTNDLSRSKNNNGGNQGDWNREHTFANSLAIPKLDDSGRNGTSFSDAHNLRASDVQRNGLRGNRLFAGGSGNSGAVGSNWYPGDASAGGTDWRGDVARVTMYMYLRYGSQCLPKYNASGNINSIDPEMIDLLLEWNAADPVSDYEDARNTYHDSESTYAQGNRNPFIDNPYLATRIWGGTPSEDRWGIYTSNDNEAPTTPTNVTLSNSSPSSIDVSWSASSDNVAVTAYEIYVDGSLNGNTSNTNYTISGLNSNTSYAVTILAKDIANNKSAQSTVVNGTTTIDNEAPTVPTSITITNQTGSSFKANWTASTDNATVVGYDVFVDGTFNASTINTSYSVSDLTASTTFSVTILAKDEADNKSAQSTAVNAVTTDGSNNIIELFFSEFIEGSGNNKALEIANLTINAIDLSGYSIKKQSNGAGGWINELTLSGTVNVNDVFVIIHFQAADANLTSQADLVAPQGSNYGAPLNFNGNDAVGLFKNGVLIDIVGVLDETAKNFEDMTLRRKLTITSPNTTYTDSEWDQYDLGVYSGIGVYDPNTASVGSSGFETFKMYPNPTNGNKLYFNLTQDIKVTIYNVLGKLIQTENVNANTNNINISTLSKGIYILKINRGNQFITKKLIKN
jgi:endonuclease I/chitodextrinase